MRELAPSLVGDRELTRLWTGGISSVRTEKKGVQVALREREAGSGATVKGQAHGRMARIKISAKVLDKLAENGFCMLRSAFVDSLLTEIDSLLTSPG